jgi:hypothetical protein
VNVLTLPLVTALVAGFTHALEADHMAAVTAFVSRRPHPLRALGFGVWWGLGHSVALLLAGGAVIALDLELSEGLVRALELAVGAMLAGLGLWALAGLLHRRTLSREHELAHRQGHPHSHPHRHGTGWVGAFHGLAGTAGFLALLPVTFISSPWLAGGYLLLFGLGTIVAMGLYALVAGLLFHRAGAHSPLLGNVLRALAGLVSVGVGVAWMGSALGG